MPRLKNCWEGTGSWHTALMAKRGAVIFVGVLEIRSVNCLHTKWGFQSEGASSILFWSVGLDTRWRHCSGELKGLPRGCRRHYLQVLSGRSEELGSTKRNPRVRCMVIDACICAIFVCNAIEKIICSLSVAMLKFILDLTDQLSLLMWLHGYTNSQLTCHILVCLSLRTRRVTPEWTLTTLATCVTQMTIDVYGPLEYWMWMMKMYVLIFLNCTSVMLLSWVLLG